MAAEALAEAEAFSLPLWTVEGGGGSSSGGSFALVGAAGQPDAGGMTGGTYELSGGFFPGSPEAPPEPEYRLYLPQAFKP